MKLWDDLAPLSEKHGLSRMADQIQAAVVEGIHLSKRVTSTPIDSSRRWFGLFKGKSQIQQAVQPAAPGLSKLGGVPDLPPEIEWPSISRKPLGFIAQIDCAMVVQVSEASLLPRSGMLFFFYDFVEQPWDGASPAEDSGRAVIYVADLPNPRSAIVPASIAKETILLPEFPIDLRVVPTLPGYDTEEGASLAFTEQERDAYFELLADMDAQFMGNQPRHKLGGFAENIQGDVRAEFAAALDSAGKPSGTADWAKATEKATEWELLLQIDSDDQLNVMWGDAGMIYFGLRREDLTSARFENSRVILQCS